MDVNGYSYFHQCQFIFGAFLSFWSLIAPVLIPFDYKSQNILQKYSETVIFWNFCLFWLWCEAEFSASLLQFSVSHDPPEHTLICCSRNISNIFSFLIFWWKLYISQLFLLCRSKAYENTNKMHNQKLSNGRSKQVSNHDWNPTHSVVIETSTEMPHCNQVIWYCVYLLGNVLQSLSVVCIEGSGAIFWSVFPRRKKSTWASNRVPRYIEISLSFFGIFKGTFGKGHRGLLDECFLCNESSGLITLAWITDEKYCL